MSDKAVANGRFVAQYLNDGHVPEEQIQPNGVDLTIGTVFRTSGMAEFTESGYSKPDRTMLEPKDDGAYRLPPGQYPIIYGEKIEIPDGYVARVYPRSRLMRSGLHLTSALWDSGYEGVGEGLLQIPRAIRKVKIRDGLPIAQMSFITAEAAESYDGTHQNERLAADD